MSKLLATTALGLVLGLGTAMAEKQTPVDDSANPPAAMPGKALPEQPADAPAMKIDPAGPSEVAPGRSSEAPQATPSDALPSKTANMQFLNKQEPHDWLASNLIGKTVVNANNESIGEINDLVTDENGKIVAALIGVGGFLGIGQKDVAVAFDDVKLTRDADNDVTAMLNTTKEALNSAPDFKTLKEQQVVQGSASDNRSSAY
jgi:sporulation protein YlmC with PRC-barrel domain